MKRKLIEGFGKAKMMHERWEVRAEAFYNGIEIDGEPPVLHTDCAFGKLLAEETWVLRHLSAAEGLDEDHRAVHDCYMALHKLMNAEVKGNIFNRSTLKREKQERLEKMMQLLKQSSRVLQDKLDLIMKQVESTPEEDLIKMMKE